MLSAHHAAASINLEFRPVNPVVLPGQQVDVGLYAVSDDQTNQLLSAIQMIFTWQPFHLTLMGVNGTGAPPLTYSGFPTSGHFGLNELPVPQDGDGFYLALSFTPVAATPLGTLITTFNFTAQSPTSGPTAVGMLLAGGEGGQTIVASGSVPGLNVTGTLSPGYITIVPAPATAGLLCGGLLLFRSRRRR